MTEQNDFTVQKVFELEARSKTGLINSLQLRNILVMERQKRFDALLVIDLVEEFGSNGFVNLSQFQRIWLYLQQIRVPFETYAKRGVLSEKKFARFLVDQLDTFINKITIESLVNFYRGELTFDVCVHALRSLTQLKQHYCLQRSFVTFDFYRDYVNRSVSPSAPYLDNPPSYEEAISM